MTIRIHELDHDVAFVRFSECMAYLRVVFTEEVSGALVRVFHPLKLEQIARAHGPVVVETTWRLNGIDGVRVLAETLPPLPHGMPHYTVQR